VTLDENSSDFTTRWPKRLVSFLVPEAKRQSQQYVLALWELDYQNLLED
jgi:hypothetical protein